MKTRKIPGINIQWPWSQLIVSGRKTIETRSYALPRKHIGQPLAIIETPGPRGKAHAGIEQARVVGVVIFKGSFRYSTELEWAEDHDRHCVAKDDNQFVWSAKTEKWGWEVASVIRFDRPQPAPKKKGIVFASSCTVKL